MPKWTARYPEKEELKKDINAMIDAFIHVAKRRFTKTQLKSTHVKGSSIKEWDSIIDYVPDLSDIDIHVTFSDVKINIEEALSFSKEVDKQFRKKRKHPAHYPIIQITDVKPGNDMMPSPKSTVISLYGEEYSEEEIHENKMRDKITKDTDEIKSYIDKLPVKLLARNNDKIIKTMQDMSWRISPLTPIILILEGNEYWTTWSMNRTQLVEKLKKEHPVLARRYTHYYVEAWAHFLTKDIKHARKSVLNGHQFLDEATQHIKGLIERK